MPSEASTMLRPSGSARLDLTAVSVGAETAKQKIRVSDGRLRTAATVAGGTGDRAGALGTDAHCAALVETGDAAAAGADLEDIGHRDLDRQAGVVPPDQGGAGGQRLALIDDAGFRRRAAHVEGDCVLDRQRLAQRLGADDAGGRARFEHPQAFALRLGGVVETAGRLHDHEGAPERVVLEITLDAADITLHARPDISVGDDGRAALELAVLFRQLVGGGDERLGQSAGDDLLDPQFVVGVAVAVQEKDRDRLDLHLGQAIADRADLGFVERPVDGAVRADALGHLETQGALDQRPVLLEEKIVGVRAVDAPNLIDVAKAFGDEQRRSRTRALEERIDRYRRAMKEQFRVLE
jgi:hypothetical protein